jgi:C-methyltransferase C-terminal domain
MQEKPDYVLILPWNLQEEIRTQMSGIAAWGGRFVTAIPLARIYP